jgi:hypothetical protein
MAKLMANYTANKNYYDVYLYYTFTKGSGSAVTLKFDFKIQEKEHSGIYKEMDSNGFKGQSL